jgi:hypothetical protein
MCNQFNYLRLDHGMGTLPAIRTDRSFPEGYMELYIARSRRAHAIARAEIDAIFANAAADPAELARLHNLRF